MDPLTPRRFVVAGTRARRTTAAALALPLALAGCQGFSDDVPTTSAAPSWPEPDPDRPVVHLEYVVAEDHETVAGTERITFTPDLEVCEVVLRSWPNKPLTAEEGNSLTVDEVLLEGSAVEHVEHAAGAPEWAPGTLLEVPLPDCAAPGQTLELEVAFTVTLGEGTDERLGRDSRLELAWLGTAYPVLAWQPGVGWARDEAVPLAGEMTTTATFDLAELSVTAPQGQQVAGVGELTGTVEHDDGTWTSTFTAPAMRDVAVTVGDTEIHDLDADGTPVHLVVPGGMLQERVQEWGDVVLETLQAAVELLGPYPYEALWVSLLPVTDGIELTGAIQVGLGDPEEQRWIVAHEIAHQWLYGLVGSNQAQHPWMDEAWSTAVQEIVAPQGWERGRREREEGLGWSMQEWHEVRRANSAYVDTVYTGGGLTLLEQRDRVGAEEWDESVRGYLTEHAHTLAEPENLRAALSHLPGVEEALAEAGAWEE